MILSFVLIILILYTYYYLVELSNCPCFVSNKDDKLYLDYMKFYLILDLFSILIALFLLKHFNGKLKSGIENILLIFSVLLVIFIHGYMTYNVYHFYNSIKAYCSCANKWQKYFVYYEGIVSGLVSIQYIVSFLLIIIILINSRY
jgi:hypothetical protein